MENRTSYGEHIPSSQTEVSKEIIGPEDITISPTECTKPHEKKAQNPPARSSIVPSIHHRSSHLVERHAQASSSSGSLDLQAVVGQSRSSLSGITIPIRLDALTYLLNNAVTGACKTPAQMPYLPQPYPANPYPQMGWPCYSTCMNSQYCSLPFPNQFPICHPGYMPCGTQPGVPAFQQHVPSFGQTMANKTQNEHKSPLPNVLSQSGMAFISNVTNTAQTAQMQDNNESSQSDGNRWANETNNRYGSKMSKSFSSESQQQNSPSRRVFVRFGDKQNEDSWLGRQQSNFRRGFGRGRGDFASQSRQGNLRGQEKDWQFGDRSRNSDYGSQKRFSESPERGNFFKRGRWPGGGGETRDTWQQRNRQNDSSNWSNPAATKEKFSSVGEVKMTTKSDGAVAEDENWETDYPEEAAASKSDDSAGQNLLNVSSPSPFSPENDCARQMSDSSEHLKLALSSLDDKGKSDKTIGAFALEVAREKEEREKYSNTEKVDMEALEPEPQVEGQDSTASPVLNSTEPMEAAEVTNESNRENVCSFVLSLDGDNSKGIFVEANEESHSSTKKVDMEVLEPEPQVEGQEFSASPVLNSAQPMEAVKVTNESNGENVCSFVLSLDGDNSKGILVEANAESHSSTKKVDMEVLDPELWIEDQDSTASPVLNSAEPVQAVEVTNGSNGENVESFVLSLDGDNSKGILVEANAESHSSTKKVDMEVLDPGLWIEDQDSTASPVLNSAEPVQAVEVTNGSNGENVGSFVLSLDGDNSKGILVEANAESHSSTKKVDMEVLDPELWIQDQDSTASPVLNSAEPAQAVEVTNGSNGENVGSFVLSLDGDNSKGILVEANAESHSSTKKVDMEVLDPELWIEDQDSTASPVLNSAEPVQAVEVTNRSDGENFYSFLLSLYGDDTKGILVELNAETHSSTEKVDMEVLEPEPRVEGQDSTASPVLNSAEPVQAVEVTNGSNGENVRSFVLSLDGDNTKGILVEVNAETHSSTEIVDMEALEPELQVD